MVALDAAVEDADAYAGTGRARRSPSRGRPSAAAGSRARSAPSPHAGSDQAGKSLSSLISTSAAARARRARSSSSPTTRLISTRWAAALRGAAGEARRGLQVGAERRVDAIGEGAGEDRDVGARLGDRERCCGCAVEHPGEREVASRIRRLGLGVGECRTRRLERVRVLLGERVAAAPPAPRPGSRRSRRPRRARSPPRPRPPPHPPAQWRARRRPVFRCEGPPPLGGAQPFANVGEHASCRLDPGVRKGRLEVGEEPLPQRGVSFGAGEEVVEPTPHLRQLLRRAHPALRRRGKRRDRGGRALRCQSSPFLKSPDYQD